MEVATLRVCVSKDISNAGRFLEVFLHLHFFMQWLLTRWQKMTAHCQDLEAVKLALSLSPFCVPVKWEFPDSIWRAQISLRPTNEQRALWEKRARLTAQTGKCGTGTTMFSSVCKTLFLFFFLVSNQQSDATSCLAGLSKPKLPSHLTTSGTGFTVARWEQSRVPLRTLFGWPLSYVTDQFWKTWCVCVLVGKHLERWMLMWVQMFSIFLDCV